MEEQTTRTAEEYLCLVLGELKTLVNQVLKKYNLRWRDKKESVSATVDYLEMKPVPEGWTHCIQHVAVNNETDAYTHLYIGTRLGSIYKVLEHTPAPAAATWYTWDGEVFLHPGEIFSVKFVGATENDVLEANARGCRQKITKPSE